METENDNNSQEKTSKETIESNNINKNIEENKIFKRCSYDKFSKSFSNFEDTNLENIKSYI
ncbi:hypothetical protein U3516DRAFT_737634 [Neocallimastix sp. 'constans']